MTIKLNFFLEMVPLSPRVADVRELDNGGGAGQGDLPAAAGDRLFLRPVILGKLDLPVPDSFRKLFLQNSFCKDCNSFHQTCYSICIVI